MKRILMLLLGLGVAGALVSAQSSKPMDLYQEGLYLQEVKGDLRKAIEVYQSIVTRYASDRAVASKALFQLATCYEKLGQPEASATYQRLVREFPDAGVVTVAARSRLAGLRPAPANVQVDGSARRIVALDNVVLTDVNREGTIAAGHEQNGTSNQSLVLVNLVSSAVTRLNVTGSAPLLSPDGRQLVYAVNGGARVLPSLWIVGTAAGSTPRTLVESNSRMTIGWSADGKSIIALGAGPELELVSLAVSDRTITTLKTFEPGLGAGSGNPIVVRLSPDGRFVAYVRNGIVYSVGIDGQNETAVAQIAGRNQLQAWSADGSRIFFTNTRSTGSDGLTWDLWSVPVHDGAVSGLPALLQKNFQGRLLGASAAGTLYSFRSVSGDSGRAMTASLFVADRSAGSRIVDMFPGESAAVSPKGNAIAFLRINTASGYYDPIIRVLATGAERLCKLNSVGPGSPTWLHDGSGFLVHLSRLPSGASGPGSFYFINATSCAPTLVLPDPTDRTRGNMVGLSLDDKTLYVLKRQTPCPGGRSTTPCSPWTGVVGVNLETGIESPVATFPGNGFPNGPSVVLSPDGATLALMVYERQAGSQDRARIATVGVNGSGYREIAGPFPASGGGGVDTLRWTPDGQSILFAMMKNDYVGWRIMRVPAGGGQPVFDGLDSNSPIGDIAVPTLGPSAPSIDVLPDGRMIVGARTVAANELWAIDSILR